MQKFTFDRRITGQFTDQQNLLAYDQEELLPFIGHVFSKDNFRKQITEKSGNYPLENRSTLVNVLKKNYDELDENERTNANLELLRLTDTFTVTTGHQLSLFTGPIFFIYKILHVVRMCEGLKIEYPENNFVPVFWMASEDHDFEEIKSVDVFGKTLSWETEQKGAVGRFSIEGLGSLTEDLSDFFHQGSADVADILTNYSGRNLAEATRKLVHRLFAKYGLIIVDGDDNELKSMFIPIVEKELKERFSFSAVNAANDHIINAGFKVQVNPREINLFYLEDQMRERILHMDEGFFVEGKGHLDLEEILRDLKATPEKFSPNVILRPVYQETVLPNLCYVGGVGELSYWLQLKGVFDAAGIVFPLIQARTSMIWIDPTLSRKIAKADLALEDLFKDITFVKNNYLLEHASEDVDFSALEKQMNDLCLSLTDKIISIDPGMDRLAEAEVVKLKKQLDAIKDKMIRSVKQQHENAMRSIDQVYDKLFPHGGMQERVLNIFSMTPDGQIGERIEHIYSCIDPFDPDLVIIRE
ncbi:MAG: bacillithiol biosynthesis cysteine-adding enzyme BshC [Flavobacteriia bacterium]|jgi:bacillithiol biosynthesis cysteine-adding enzyme BshC